MENESQLSEHDREIKLEPKVIFDGHCPAGPNHDYVDSYTDAEGVTVANCTRCPMGRRYMKESPVLNN